MMFRSTEFLRKFLPICLPVVMVLVLLLLIGRRGNEVGNGEVPSSDWAEGAVTADGVETRARTEGTGLVSGSGKGKEPRQQAEGKGSAKTVTEDRKPKRVVARPANRIRLTPVIGNRGGFLTGPSSGDPLDVGIGYLKSLKDTTELTAEDLADPVVTSSHTSSHNGVTHIYLRQQFEGLEVYSAVANVNVAADGRIISANSDFVSHLSREINRRTPVLSAEQAVKSAAAYLGVVAPDRFQEESVSGEPDRRTVFEGGELSRDPIPVRLMYMPHSNRETRLVWNTILRLDTGNDWLNLNVDAVTGEVLSESNWVASADYRVFALPLQNPDDGTRTLENDPWDTSASPLGWHDTDGVAGAEFTDTRGNNVHAQEDADDDDTGGYRPDAGAGLDFDFSLDLNQAPQTYEDASLTNLFYHNNIVHDIFYHYGFDEAAGNFQENNYGRGGTGGDPVDADGLDGSGYDNANFATPPDGMRPRMQMYLWFQDSGGTFVDSPASIEGEYTSVSAAFGPVLSSTITAPLVLANDGSASPTLACFPLTNGAEIAGNIALIDRGSCDFDVKVKNAENAGAVAVLIANNLPNSNLIRMTGDDDTITIPSFFISYEDGQTIRSELETGVTMSFRADSYRDSSLDNLVIIHEYGHGISNRLTGGAANADALVSYQSRGMGEGWSDWFGLVLTAKPGDTDVQPRGVGTYLLGEPLNGPGIRPAPYSTDLAVNDLTYGDLGNGNLSIPHGIGTVWCTTLWELYWNFVDMYGFDPDLYGGSGGNNKVLQLVVDGLKMQPADPTYLEARDAILLADQVNNGGANEDLIWAAFAKRGMGVDADDGGDPYNLDVVESFDIPDDLSVTPKKGAPTEISGAPGGPFTPSSWQYSLENTGAEVLNWNFESVSSWISVSPSSGTLAPGIGATVTASLNGGVNSLPAGLNSGNVTFRNLSSGRSIPRSVFVSANNLAPAVEQTTLSFFTGDLAWFPQSTDSHDGVDAARSAAIGDQQKTKMSTQVTGPDTLTFWWKVSSEPTYDFLRLFLDGTEISAIEGEVDWRQVLLSIPAGNHKVEWVYDKDYSLEAGDDAGWVDQVSLSSAGGPPSVPVLTQASDLGDDDSDGITSDDTPEFAGTAPPGAMVTIVSDLDGPLGTVTANAYGGWSFVSGMLSEGTHTITITVPGQPTPAPLTVVIDTTVAMPTGFALDPLSDAGVSNSDGITNDIFPSFTASVVEEGTVELTSSVDGNLGSGTGSGDLDVYAFFPSEGTHEITAKFIDVAGNESASTAPVMVEFDYTPPDAIGMPDLAEESDTGDSPTDNVTSDDTPTFSGSSDTDTTVAILFAGEVIASGDGAASWELTASSLDDGSHEIYATQSDVAGNESDPSAPLLVTIDTKAPFPPAAPDLEDGSDSGVSNTDNITSAIYPQFSGSCDPADHVMVFEGTNMIVEGPGGDWQLTSPVSLASGNGENIDRFITVRLRDAAGNVGNPSSPTQVTIDTKPPQPVISRAPNQPNPASGAPVSFKIDFGENVENFQAATVQLSGTAVPGSPTLTGGKRNWVYTAQSVAGEGTVRIDVDAGAVADTAGNNCLADNDTGNVITVEAKNTRGAAREIPFSSGSGSFSGMLTSGDVDVFSFVLTDPLEIRIRTTGGTNTLGKLYDDYDNVLNDFASDDDLGDGENFEIDTALLPGTYYVEVSGGATNGEGDYVLELLLGDEAASQPDSRAGRSLGASVGNNVYGSAGRQTAVLKTKSARKISGVVGIENDGAIRDEFTVFGTGGNSTFKVIYSSRDGNVSGSILTGRLKTGEMRAGDSPYVISVIIKPNKRKLQKIIRRGGQKIVKYKKGKLNLTFHSRSSLFVNSIDSVGIKVISK